MAIAAVALYGPWRRLTPSRVINSSQARPRPQQRGDAAAAPRKAKKPPLRDARLAAADDAAVPSWRRRPRRAKPSGKKWQEKRTDAEFDLVIVPLDGISMSGSDSGDESDWSIGWFEPHSKKFTADDDDDSFAVLMPCYGSPPTAAAAARKPFAPKEEPPKPPVWATMLANLSRQTSGDHKKHLDRWLAGL